MNTSQTNGEYPTSDTPLAAYLLHQGFNLLIIRYVQTPSGKQKGIYYFEDSPQLREHVSLYNRGDATINVAMYEHAKSTLLDRVTRGLP